jgi:hypothetical protein
VKLVPQQDQNPRPDGHFRAFGMRVALRSNVLLQCPG